MADDQPRDRDSSAQDAEPAPDQPEVQGRWSSPASLWQVPTIVLSVVLILAGLRVAMTRAPGPDFDGALAQVEQLLEAGELDLARTRLAEVIEPRLPEATTIQSGRFHRVVADLIDAIQQAEGTTTLDTEQLIAGEYARAAEHGVELDPRRIERWGTAQIVTGDVVGARDRLEELDALDALAGAETAADVRRRRNRLLRRLLDATLTAGNQGDDAMHDMLDSYRADPRLSGNDEAWAVARQAELRLNADDPQTAVDYLLIDMRRLETQSRSDDSVDFGELHMLLGRGYVQLGEFDHAEHQLDRALALLDDSDPARGGALLWLGRVLVSRGDHPQALERFDEVVREFVGTRHALPALFARAEMRSVLGEHDAAIADCLEVAERLDAEGTAGLSREAMSDGLIDRHEAALTGSTLDVALRYAETAEKLFDEDEVPGGVLRQIAATRREIARKLAADARDPDARRADDLAPEVRRQVSEHERVAAEYELRYARIIHVQPSMNEAWAAAVMRAAEGFDRAGAFDQAIAAFREYISRRGDGEERTEAIFRLARCLQAVRNWEQAAQQYETLHAEHPTSAQASSSHVPLARCYVELDRRPDAEAQLGKVLRGQIALDPAAADYRDALLEMGRIHYDAGEYREAIELLTEALDRYPDDHRRTETIFRLADSYRGSADAAAARLVERPEPVGADRVALEDMLQAGFEQAAELYAAAIDGYLALDQQRLDPLDRQFLRFSFLYRADCAYQLGDYREAIERYDLVARRYHGHQSSMIALVQIVNCYHHLGERDLADGAHERALVRLQQLPDDAFDSPDTLMDREAWRRWLEMSPPNPDRTASVTSNG